MYTPNLFTNDVFGLWGKEGSNNHSKLYEHHRKHNEPLTNEQAEDQRNYLRSLFAPPLVAYSAEYPGAKVFQLEYTIKTQSSGSLNAPLLTPLTQSKLERTRRIRKIGYSTITPVGIEKTMEQIDAERSRRNALIDHDTTNSAENTNTETNELPDISAATDVNEVNLDEQIINSDDYQQDTDEFEDLLQNHEEDQTRYDSDEERNNVLHDDEGFMADEVEYQDDHSIINDIGVGPLSGSLVGSGTTASTMTNSMLNSVNSARTMSTMTEADSIERCNDENAGHSDHSDLDMVIDD